jgi:hypothetical protein
MPDTDSSPLADYCSLCGEGYYPNIEISISDEPTDGRYRWCHVLCKEDHDRAFLEAFDEK